MRTRLALAAALAAATLLPGPAAAQSFVDTTVSFSVADDNLLRDPGETRRNSPEAYFGQAAASPLDRLEPTAFHKSYSRMVLGKKLETGELWPEAALRIKYLAKSDGTYAFNDDGSYLKLNYTPSEELRWSLAFYPQDADKVRLGYHYDISWGGTNVFPKNFRNGLVPGVVTRLDLEVGYVFLGAKSALIRSPSPTILDNPGSNTNQYVERAYYGGFAGLGVGQSDGLKAEVSGGYFQKGTNTKAGVLGEQIYAGGGSAQLSYHRGGEVGQRMDLRLYNEDPEQFPLDSPERYKAGFGLDVAMEGTLLVQTLGDPDHYASTKNEYARAGAFAAGVRFNRLRLHLDVIYRDLSFIVFNVPGFDPYNALSKSVETTPELFGVISVDYFFEKVGLTPALSLAVLRPATFEPTTDGLAIYGAWAEYVTKGIHKVVVRGAGDWDILPVGDDEMPVPILKLDLKWSIQRTFSVVGELTVANDMNTAQVDLDEHGHARLVYTDPWVVGVGMVAEMVF